MLLDFSVPNLALKRFNQQHRRFGMFGSPTQVLSISRLGFFDEKPLLKAKMTNSKLM